MSYFVFVQAPELLRAEPGGLPSDVYSLALIGFELYTSTRPYPVNWNIMQLLQFVALQQQRPQFPTSGVVVPLPLQQLLTACWNPDPQKRPTAAQLLSHPSLA